MKLLVIGLTWPEPKTTGAGVRMQQLLQSFTQQDWEVFFASTAEAGPYSLDLVGMGVKPLSIRLNDPSFDDLIKTVAPEVVLFDRFMTEEQFGWRVAENAPAALRILDTEDLHSLRETRRILAKTKRPFSEAVWLDSDLCMRELASIYRSDLSLIISSHEMDLLLRNGIPDHTVYHLPFVYTPTEKPVPAFSERKDFVFIGNGKHKPNVDAILNLHAMWPAIKEALASVRLHIYGAYLPERCKQLHDPASGFHIHGWVEDAAEVMRQSRVQLAPLHFGAGQKGKVLLAMQWGTPTVSTAVGAEGIAGADAFPGAIAADPQAFVKAAVTLYQHEPSWAEAAQRGRAHVSSHFNRDLLIPDFIRRLKAVRSKLESHRRDNLVGRIMNHQTLGASRYLAKYIEAKNRNSMDSPDSSK